MSINGGPEVPMSTVKAALDIVRGRSRAGHGPDEEKHKNIAGDRLRSIVQRIERLEEERKALSSDITDIFSEAKGAGFDVKVVRQLIRIRKMDPAEREEQETLLDVYMRAIGM